MKVTEVLDGVKDAITVKRVYGEPLEKHGMTVVPAAVVMGGGGGGTGKDEKGQEGEGGGFGTHGRPAGAWIIADGHVTWRPAVDPNRIMTMLGLVLMAWLVTRPRMMRAKAAAAKSLRAGR